MCIAVLAGYMATATWSTWPLARHASSTLPMTTLRVGTVPLFNLWTVWWNADRLQCGLQRYWSAPIFHPTPDTFAFSEAQPTTMLVAPVIWLTGSRELACNGYLLLSLVLNAVFTERLLRQLRFPRPLAVCGGFAMLLLPLVHQQLEVLQLVPIWGIVWTWMACRRLGIQPSLRAGIEAGAAFGVTFLTCSHQALLLSFLLAVTAWILPVRWNRRELWLAAAAAVVVAGVMVAPLAWKFHEVAQRGKFRREPDIVSQLSAKPAQYLRPTGLSWFERTPDNGNLDRGFNPGWVKVSLAMLGLLFGLSRRSHRRWTMFLLALAGVAFCLSLGPNLQLGTWQPWWMLSHLWPGFAQVRSVFRFAFFTQMVSVILSVQGLYGGWILVRACQRLRTWRPAIQWCLLLLGIAAAMETHPAPVALFNTPNAAANAKWIAFVRDHTAAGEGVACIPFPQGDTVEAHENEARWMYYGTYHGKPLMNGYSGFFPVRYFALQDDINAGFPSLITLKKLRNAGVDLVVINRNITTFPDKAEVSVGGYVLTRVFEDEVGIDVYRLREQEVLLSRP